MGSDISIKQTKPYNTSVHVSLNVGSGSKVKVEMTDAVNLQLHISFNGMSDSEVEVSVEKAYNSSVHVSFQNPVKTPVKEGTISTISSALQLTFLSADPRVRKRRGRQQSSVLQPGLSPGRGPGRRHLRSLGSWSQEETSLERADQEHQEEAEQDGSQCCQEAGHQGQEAE